MLGIIILVATGTIVESKLDAAAAQKLVYHTPWMFGVLGLLAINLIMVMVDRWPWKWRHLPFLLAHVGIILLLFGALLTYFYGIDGNLRLEVGKSSRQLVEPKENIVLYSTNDEINFQKLLAIPVDFFLNRPSEKRPFTFNIYNETAVINSYIPYALPSKKIVPSSDPTMPAAIRYQLLGSKAQQSDWLLEQNFGTGNTQDLGPLQLHFSKSPDSAPQQNSVYFQFESGKIKYQVYRKGSLKPDRFGLLEEGAETKLGFMDFTLKILRILDHAEETWEIKEALAPTPLTIPVAQLIYKNKNYWLLLNDYVKLKAEDKNLRIALANQRLNLGFDVRLLEFKVDHYQGTKKAAEYKSYVSISQGQDPSEEFIISMNKPLKFNGYTLYQASFEEDSMGNPISSILSVNKDPGRITKYVGSLLTSLGIITLFYFRKKKIKPINT